MKRIARTCLATLCLALALCATTASAWADEISEIPDSLTDSAVLLSDDAYQSGASVDGQHYDNIQKAWSAAYSAAAKNGSVTFDLFEDWTIVKTSYWGRTYLGEGTGFYDGRIEVPAKARSSLTCTVT